MWLLRFLAALGVALLALIALVVATWLAMREETATKEAHRARLALGHYRRAPGGAWVGSAVYDGDGRALAGPQSDFAPDPKRETGR